MKRPGSTYLLLLGVIVLLLVLSYNGFKLLQLRTENKAFREKIIKATSITSSITNLKQELSQNSIQIEENIFPIKTEVFSLVGDVQSLYGITVKDITQVENRETQAYNILSYRATLEADYVSLLKAAQFIEKKCQHTRVSSISFESTKLRGNSNQWKLNMKIYVQGVVKL